MLLVVIGHLVVLQGNLYQIIYLFHMPFFFFVSGFTSSEKSLQQPFINFFLKLVKSLLIPIYLYRIIDFSINVFLFGKSNTDLLLFLTSPDIHWFLSALFLSRILFYFVYKIQSKVNFPREELFYLTIAFISVYIGDL